MMAFHRRNKTRQHAIKNRITRHSILNNGLIRTLKTQNDFEFFQPHLIAFKNLPTINITTVCRCDLSLYHQLPTIREYSRIQ